MGACFSSGGESITTRPNSAFVISPKGDLRPYSTPVSVSDVLRSEVETGATTNFFICNSDNLSYNEHITPLDEQEELDAGQIYFVLPISKLRGPLTASEMAALAVKASAAMNAKANSKIITSSSRKRKNKSKISPFVVMQTSKINVMVDEEAQNKRLFEQQQMASSSLGVSRSGSIRKMQRYSSRKARLSVRIPSFKLRLSTIYESELLDQSHKYY